NLEGFGSQFYGVYIAPASGNYKFAIATDDNGQLFLSTDATPAHKVLIASVPDWTDERNYITRSDGAGVNAVSTPVTLVAGNPYYIEALQKEGGGGDHVEVAVRRPGDPAIANGQAGIPLDQFAPDPSGLQYYRAGDVTYTPGPVTLTAQPADVITVEGQTASFSVDYFGTPPITVQWFSNNVAIAGATGKSVSIFA